MKKYTRKDIEIGNEVMFKRAGVDNYDLDWTVVGFYGDMVKVKIDTMGQNEEIFIDYKDIIRVSPGKK